MRSFTPRFIVAATVIAMVGSGAAVGAVGVQRMGEEAEHARLEVRELGMQHDRWTAQLDSTGDVFEALLTEAMNALSEAQGKLLSEEPADAVARAIVDLRDARDRLEAADTDAKTRFDRLSETISSVFWWPPDVSAEARKVSSPPADSAYRKALSQLGQALDDLRAARAAWDAEQQRIAAEKKAADDAAAAAKRAEQRAKSSKLSQGGGSTAPNAPRIVDPPVTNSTQAQIVDYLGQFVAGVPVTWDPDLCPAGTICGITQLGAPTPTIVLDPDLLNYYLTPSGKYVLVHEAAHARSWFLYGSIAALSAASVAVTGIEPDPPGSIGRAAIEYMADCATIVKLGYSGGTYTFSCTADQLAEGAKYW
ncbi:MAG TPA: hypothetical protein VK139_02070 [Microbacteriaceae bacterium]|nr:hypothetical protein [Microbacteriaceae bacterium]